MTQTFATNETNDLYRGRDGNLAIVSGLEAVKQACQTAVKAQKNEMIYAYEAGMPDFAAIWVGSPNYGQYRAALNVTLAGVDGVLSIEKISLERIKNRLAYQAVITTRYGSAVIRG